LTSPGDGSPLRGHPPSPPPPPNSDRSADDAPGRRRERGSGFTTEPDGESTTCPDHLGIDASAFDVLDSSCRPTQNGHGHRTQTRQRRGSLFLAGRIAVDQPTGYEPRSGRHVTRQRWPDSNPPSTTRNVETPSRPRGGVTSPDSWQSRLHVTACARDQRDHFDAQQHRGRGQQPTRRRYRTQHPNRRARLAFWQVREGLRWPTRMPGAATRTGRDRRRGANSTAAFAFGVTRTAAPIVRTQSAGDPHGLPRRSVAQLECDGSATLRDRATRTAHHGPTHRREQGRREEPTRARAAPDVPRTTRPQHARSGRVVARASAWDERSPTQPGTSRSNAQPPCRQAAHDDERDDRTRDQQPSSQRRDGIGALQRHGGE
jgi:hypothetical protein